MVVVPPMAPGAPAGEQPEHRRVYITRADLDRHGYTQDCPGCAAAQSNQRPRTHSEGCRARLEEAMTQDELGWDRLLRAALRRAEPTDAVPEEQDADNELSEGQNADNDGGDKDGDKEKVNTSWGEDMVKRIKQV